MTIATMLAAALLFAPSSQAQGQLGGKASMVTWSCVGVQCPWGATTSGRAVAWPRFLSPLSKRLGYTASSGVYVTAAVAMGMTITITRGEAGVYAGRVDEAAHRVVATLRAGESRRIAKVHADEVVSVQSKARFEYRIDLPLRRSPPLPPRPTCVSAAACVVLASRTAYWHCDTDTCSGEPWVGQAVSWGPWAAQASNGRSGSNSRTVHSDDGSELYPYMGPWADGCVITALSGTVLIVEWRRGSDSWRETVLKPGETHTIDLVGAEDSALIESPGIGPFSVAVGNCIPPSQGQDPTAPEP